MRIPGRLVAQQLTAKPTHCLVNSSPTNSTLLVSDSQRHHPKATTLKRRQMFLSPNTAMATVC